VAQYWEGGYGGALGITPYPLFENPVLQEPPKSEQQDDPYLRSTRQVTATISMPQTVK